MTIIASVKVRDGLILGTDSMTQISIATEQGPQFLKAYSNARKLFQINDRMGAMTYGLGNIGNRSIEGIVIDFARQTPPNTPGTVEEASGRLYDFVRAQYDAELDSVPADQRPGLGFYVAGYSEQEPFSEEFEFLLPRDEAPFAARPAGLFGASWRGVDAPFTRLYKGFDPYILPQRLIENGVEPAQLDAIFAPDGGLETGVIYDGMPVQDAINFAAYILETTIGWSTFAVGVPACGGPLQLATITTEGGFTWVTRPDPQYPSPS